MTHFNILKQAAGKPVNFCSRRPLARLSLSLSTAKQQKSASCIILLVFQLFVDVDVGGGRERKDSKALDVACS